MTGPFKNDEEFLASADAARWSNVLARITPAMALNIDNDIGEYDPQRALKPGRVVFPEGSGLPAINRQNNRRPAIGIMVSDNDESIETLAARLAALAIERDCEVIALTQGAISGLERFGFRTERIAGETKATRDECLEQIRRFWNLEIIL